MARKLKLVTTHISQYLAKRFPKGSGASHKIPPHANRESLPAPLYIAFLQGEALLRLKFFAYLQERSISDPNSLVLLWQQLITDKKYIQQIVEASGLLNYFIFGQGLAPDTSQYKEQCFTAYCILIFDASEAGNNNLVIGLTKGLVVHFMPALYPEQPKVTDSKLLKNQIAKQLALKWGLRPEIKESFITNEGRVSFSLVCKLRRRPPVTLITLEGNRLKPTRLKAYQALLEDLGNNTLKIELPPALLEKK